MEDMMSKGKQNDAESMANTINVTIHPNDRLLLAIEPKTPESKKNIPHQIPAPAKCASGLFVDNPIACVIIANIPMAN